MTVKNGTSKDAKGVKSENRIYATSPIRVSQKTKTKLAQLLDRANKGRVGRKVKGEDLVSFSLELISEQHLSEICSRTLRNRDRMELLFLKLTKERRCSSREDFFGLLLEGKFTS